METEGRNIAFISGGVLSKSSLNKLNRYRNKLSENYDDKKKREIKNFISNLNEGVYNAEEFEKILNILHLIKNPVDKFSYDNWNLNAAQKMNMLQQFIQRNMYSIRTLKKLQSGKEKCFNEIFNY